MGSVKGTTSLSHCQVPGSPSEEQDSRLAGSQPGFKDTWQQGREENPSWFYLPRPWYGTTTTKAMLPACFHFTCSCN